MKIGTAREPIRTGEHLMGALDELRVELTPGPRYDLQVLGRHTAAGDIAAGQSVAVDWSGRAWPVLDR
jgi:hypothetical protein